MMKRLHWQNWQWKEQGMGILEDKVIKITLLRNIFTTDIRMKRHVVYWKRINPTG